jgi:uncharacterized protein YndB with AHSA1/START domain
MNSAAPIQSSDPGQTQDIVVDEVLPHAPETVWKALTDGALMKRWMMEPSGFAPVVGKRFTYQTKPAGAWDGTIHCEVLEVIPQQRFSYAWRGGDDANVGYGAKLDTVVTWSLSKVAAGTRLKLVHAGFVAPRNDTAFQNMSSGWKTVVAKLDQAIKEH